GSIQVEKALLERKLSSDELPLHFIRTPVRRGWCRSRGGEGRCEPHPACRKSGRALQELASGRLHIRRTPILHISQSSSGCVQLIGQSDAREDGRVDLTHEHSRGLVQGASIRPGTAISREQATWVEEWGKRHAFSSFSGWLVLRARHRPGRV